MKEITLKNFRCFHTEQKARLAPLTLLVGENSTGKTSLLAMIRALWDCIYGHRNPNFKEAPFDLGSYEEIAHHQSKRSGPAAKFEINVQIEEDLKVKVVFEKEGTIPVPVNACLIDREARIEDFYDAKRGPWVQLSTSRGSWKAPLQADSEGRFMPFLTSRRLLPFMIPEVFFYEAGLHAERTTNLIPLNGRTFSKEDAEEFSDFRLFDIYSDLYRPFASAPVRSKPRRTYDPASPVLDPEGDFVPMYMANLASDHEAAWENMKKRLESFGSDAGIFDEIEIRRLGKSGSAPFQIQVRKFSKKRKGPKQNLIDVGYGVSQVLPILTELLSPGNSRMALLQQPEVHLHPRAQAELGSLFCKIAGQERQLVVETHSDHLIDRVSMDVRDGKTNLKPEDVSILFFERKDLSVQIHPIRLDKEGNVLDAPQSYRRFFMEETRRSLSLW